MKGAIKSVLLWFLIGAVIVAVGGWTDISFFKLTTARATAIIKDCIEANFYCDEIEKQSDKASFKHLPNKNNLIYLKAAIFLFLSLFDENLSNSASYIGFLK